MTLIVLSLNFNGLNLMVLQNHSVVCVAQLILHTATSAKPREEAKLPTQVQEDHANFMQRDPRPAR